MIAVELHVPLYRYMSWLIVCLIVGGLYPNVASAQDKQGPRTDLPPALAERLEKEESTRSVQETDL